MSERYLTPEEVAKRLSVSPKSVRNWLKSRRLKGVKVGRLWRVSEEELGIFLLLPKETAETAKPKRISALGICADLPGFGTEQFMKDKQKEIDLEEEKFQRHFGKASGQP
jgi:excisionase family DNA binding protein